jgi:DNA-binding NarL/FixJ family response regulator
VEQTGHEVEGAALLEAQRLLRDRLLGSAAPRIAERDLAAEMLLYLDDPVACSAVCADWVLRNTGADRVEGGFAAPADSLYRPFFERQRGSLPTMLGMTLDAHDGGIAAVWSEQRVVVFPDMESDRRISARTRQALRMAGTRRKLAVALRDRGREVGLLCADSASATTWRSDEYERLDRVAREVIGPVLGAARRLDEDRARPEAMPASAACTPDSLDLTPAELRVAHLVVAGFSYKEIARRLDRSCSTIDHQLRSMRGKLGVSSTAKLMRELTRRLSEGAWQGALAG